MNCGDRITMLRKKRFLTQCEVARRIGVTRSAYSHYEHNRRKPNYSTLKRISSLFQVSTDYLLGRTDDPTYVLPLPVSAPGSRDTDNKEPIEQNQSTVNKIVSFENNRPPKGKHASSKKPTHSSNNCLELSDSSTLKLFQLTVDGKTVTEEEARRFIAYIRAERQKFNQG